MVVAGEVDQVLIGGVEAGAVPGVFALAADGGVFHAGAFGVRDVDIAAPIGLDTMVSIAFMTRAVTSVAAMQLVERGRIGLDEPPGAHLPELAAVQVLNGFDATGAPSLRPPCRSPTHTSGFAYAWSDGRLLCRHVSTDTPTVEDGKRAGLLVPLVADPGERWAYSIAIDWAGQLVKRLSGRSLEDYPREHLLGPLGMHDTGFILRPNQLRRLGALHRRRPDGSLLVVPSEQPANPGFFEGGGGPYSPGPDYLRYPRVPLGGGQLDGARVLRTETVAETGTNQTGDFPAGVVTAADPDGWRTVVDFDYRPGLAKGWGLAALLNLEQVPTGRAAAGWS